MTDVGVPLSDAVERHVRPGDAVHVMLGHSRWTAAARELARQRWGTDAGLDPDHDQPRRPLGALFFRGGMVRKVVTAYSGNSFPSYAPNPIFQHGYESGDVEVEHWSILTLGQRLEAAARGSAGRGDRLARRFRHGGQRRLHRGRLAVRPGRACWPHSRPTWRSCHAAVADREGNLAVSEPLLEGVWGAWAARRGVVATVEAIVDDLDGLGHRVRIPAHRVLAVVETPFGAHPGGLLRARTAGGRLRRGHPVLDRRRRGRPAATSTPGPGSTCSTRPTTTPTCGGWATIGSIGLRLLADPESWRSDADAHPVAGRRAGQRLGGGGQPRGPRGPVACVTEHRADAVLAGAGVANLAAWVAVARARAAGSAGAAHRRARPVGLHPDAGRSRTSSTTGSSPAPPCSPMPRPCWAWWSAARGPSPSAAWARPRWTGTGTSTPPDSGTAGSSSGRAEPTTWSAGRRPAWW